MKIIKTSARELRERITGIVNKQNLDPNPDKEYKLKVEVEIHENWLTKKGITKRMDIMNREKFLTDSIFKALGVDDKFIYEYNIKKIQSKTEKAVIKISEIKWNTQEHKYKT